jgi:hypothetical protein
MPVFAAALAMSETNKAVVRRLVDEVMNAGHMDVINDIYAPQLAPIASRWIAPFRESFPDVQMTIATSSPKPTKWSDGSTAPAPTAAPGGAIHPPAGASTT